MPQGVNLFNQLIRSGRWFRRTFSRTRWAARLLNLDLSARRGDDPGLIIIQIDGLARQQLEVALAKGRMPFLNKLLKRNHYDKLSFYSGLPSTTPAVQAEVMFGARCAVPAFQFLHRETGKTAIMYEQEWAQRFGEQLSKDHQPLLEGGRSYSNIYAAGAKEARLCAETMDLATLREMTSGWKLAIVLLLYGFTILRVLALAFLELIIALMDMVRGLAGQQSWRAEFHCIPSRVIVSIAVREWLRIMIKLAIAEGAPIVFGNFLGYDEQSHRRGPGSLFAHWGLKGIDSVIHDIFRAAHTSDLRDYEVIIYSDHGQERTQIYETKTGISIHEAVVRAFKEGPLSTRSVRPFDKSQTRRDQLDQRWRRMLRGKPGAQQPKASIDEVLKEEIVVTALGPIGHVYLPIKLSDEEKTVYAEVLAGKEQVPLVMFRDSQGQLRAFNSAGQWQLPDDGRHVLGEQHPFLEEASADLVRLSQHPDAGDLMISGWNPAQEPVTFVEENGAHGSMGSEETRGFALVPHSVQLQNRRAHNNERYIRGVDLYRAAWQFVHGERPREIAAEQDPQDALSALASRRANSSDDSFKVMTYNIHSCIGIDEKIRPERIISVIKSCDADVIALQEVDSHRYQSRGHAQAELIADVLSMSHHYYAISDWNGEQYGLAILSRFPIEHVKSDHLTPLNAAMCCEARGAMWVRIETPMGPVNLINTHFGLRQKERQRQAEILLSDDWIGGISTDEPVLLCGDFNAGPRSRVYNTLAQRLVDVQRYTRKPRPKATFASIFPIVRIDHIFASRHFDIRSVSQPRTPTAKVASDHLPVCVELSLPPQAAPEAVSPAETAQSAETQTI
jgi:endonuclease/exonuclease/phosphatase family metal-dependent hydrolase